MEYLWIVTYPQKKYEVKLLGELVRFRDFRSGVDYYLDDEIPARSVITESPWRIIALSLLSSPRTIVRIPTM